MKAPLKILQKALTTALAVAAVMAFILIVVPDGNDYALVTIDKHARLEQTRGRKLVFVGGSNLAYGLDSQTIENAVNYTVVNMGMNAYLGTRFLMNEVEASLKSGDVVVLSIENDLFRVQPLFDGVEGRTEDLLMMVKVRPASLSYVSDWSRRRRMLGKVPEIVHRKTMRLINDAVHTVEGHRKVDPIEVLETRAGFNAFGDLVSHVSVNWSGPREPGLDLAKLPPNDAVVRSLGEYQKRWSAMGVHVFIAPPPVPAPYYETEKQVLLEIQDVLTQAMTGAIIAPIERYVFPDSCFFDDSHHLNGKCRMERSKLLAEDLTRVLGSRSAHAAGGPATSQEF